ncbi:MAG TPA: hypothetical protein VM123_13970 [archaeon]|nr:hypothetical protein [archaeon]
MQLSVKEILFLLLVAKEAKPFLFKQKETKVNPGNYVFYSASPSSPGAQEACAKACLGGVHISEHAWKLLVFYTLQKQGPRTSGLLMAPSFTWDGFIIPGSYTKTYFRQL